MDYKLYHVVAMANGRVIGKDNKLPWHFPSDLKHFRQLTTGGTVIMGRKTYDSIGKPLANRANFVLSRTRYPVAADHLKFFDAMDGLLESIRTPNAFIVGGANLYGQTMDMIDGIYLTRIHADYEGDTFYPEIPDYFKERSRIKLQDNPKIEVIFHENTKKQ